VTSSSFTFNPPLAPKDNQYNVPNTPSNCNQWTTVAAETFNVRVGPNYKKYGRKASSGPAFFECIGMDAFKLDKKCVHIAPQLVLPDVGGEEIEGIKPLLIFNVQLPSKSCVSARVVALNVRVLVAHTHSRVRFGVIDHLLVHMIWVLLS
jgi:hypothetical protein